MSSLLIAPIVKNSHISTRIYFIFLKNVLKPTWKSLIPNFDLSEKITKAVTKQGKFLALFRILIALILG